MFRGRFEAKLDPKGRLSLPSSFRDVSAQKDRRWVITNSLYRKSRCLDVFLWKAWEQIEKTAARWSPLRAEAQVFQRFYLSGGQLGELDNQCRLQIPQSLRQFAGLDGDVVLVGMGKKFEVWASRTWAIIHEELINEFETTLAQLDSKHREDKG